MNLSILLAYRDRKDNLLSLLTQVKRNLMFFKGQLEVIVVDLGSGENLESRLAHYPFVTYQYIDYKDTFSKAWALNMAFKTAKHDWLFILDADCVFLEKFLVNVSVFVDEQDSETFYLFGGVRELNGVLTNLVHAGHIITNKIKTPMIDHFDNLADMAGVGNIIVHRKRFESLTGMDEKMIGWGREDSDFYNRLKASGAKEVTIPAEPGQSLFHLLHGRGDVTYNNLLIFYQNDFVELYNKEKNIISPNKSQSWGDETVLPDQYRYESLYRFHVEETASGLPTLKTDSLYLNNPGNPGDWEGEFEPGIITHGPGVPVILLGGGLNYACKSLLEVTDHVVIAERFQTVKNLAVQHNGIETSRFIDTGFQHLTEVLIKLKAMVRKTVLVHKPSFLMEPRWYGEVKKFIESP